MKYYFPIQVRFAETDLQGHVFFGNYLIYFDEAVSGYMRAIGCTYNDFRAAGADVLYVHSECDYISRAFFEEILHVYATAAHIGNTSITFECAAHKASTHELVARGKIVAVTVDETTREKVRVPEVFRRAVAAFEQA